MYIPINLQLTFPKFASFVFQFLKCLKDQTDVSAYGCVCENVCTYACTYVHLSHTYTELSWKGDKWGKYVDGTAAVAIFIFHTNLRHDTPTILKALLINFQVLMDAVFCNVNACAVGQFSCFDCTELNGGGEMNETRNVV